MSSARGVHRALWTVLLATALAGGVAAARAERVAERSRSATIEFGIWVQDAAGQTQFVATAEVPCEDGQAFGWRMRRAAPGGPMKWVEVLRLPATPPSWEGVRDDPTVTVSADGRTATTVGESLPGEVYAGHVWYVSAGDPSGEYRMSVEFDNGRKATFRFRLVTPKDRPKPAPAGEVI